MSASSAARATALAEALVATLPSGQATLFNPWADHCPHSINDDGPAARRERLARHLDCEARFILLGEAPGYQGCRYSGVAFSSERLLLEGAIPRIERLTARITNRPLPFSEPSATIVWKTLYRLGLAETTILWNALQMHPHGASKVWSNRTPSDTELALGQPALKLLLKSYPKARVVAVGRKAELALALAGVSCDAAVRHPANGGATEFAEGLSKLAA